MAVWPEPIASIWKPSFGIRAEAAGCMVARVTELCNPGCRVSPREVSIGLGLRYYLNLGKTAAKIVFSVIRVAFGTICLVL
jgi:hypothetical protein